MKKSTKQERNQNLIKFIENHTINEAAERFGISRQRVFQITEKYGVDLKNRKVGKGGVFRSVVQSDLLGTNYDTEVARQLGVSERSVFSIRKALGIERFSKPVKPIGCEKCKTEPYARGLCRACHSRKWRRAKHPLRAQNSIGN